MSPKISTQKNKSMYINNLQSIRISPTAAFSQAVGVVCRDRFRVPFVAVAYSLYDSPIFTLGCIQNRVDNRQKFTDHCVAVRSYGFNKELPCLLINTNAPSLARNINCPLPRHRATRVQGSS